MNFPARSDLENRTAIAYDAFAPIGMRHENPVFVDSIMLSVRNLMIHQPRLLDLGCGLGRMIPIFHELDILQVVGVDYSKESVRIAKERYPEHDFRIGNILNLKEVLGDEKFDAFFAIATLLHILPENMRLAIANIRDALSVGAIGFIATPFGDEEDILNPGGL